MQNIAFVFIVKYSTVRLCWYFVYLIVTFQVKSIKLVWCFPMCAIVIFFSFALVGTQTAGDRLLHTLQERDKISDNPDRLFRELYNHVLCS